MNYQRGNVNRSVSLAEIWTIAYDVRDDEFKETRFEMQSRIRNPDRVRRILNRTQKGRFMIIKVISIKFIRKTYSMDFDEFIKQAQLINTEEEENE